MEKILTPGPDLLDIVLGRRKGDGLPDIEALSDLLTDPPPLPEELIGGILRKGHKMLVSGASKAGKSFLLMELCIALAERREWLGWPCTKGKVLYVNLEIDRASCLHRFGMIYDALGIRPGRREDLQIWNLRGYAAPLEVIVPALESRVKDKGFSAIVIDPIYKLLTGDENSASDIGAFCNRIDRICCGTGASVIYCHHHSKGAQGSKRAMDRASGSGVFGRDPDAILDIIELELTPEQKYLLPEGLGSAWRVEASLREFADTEPKDIWFRCPIHVVDTEGLLTAAQPAFSQAANLMRSPNRTSETWRRDMLERAYAKASADGPATLKKMAESTGKSERTLRRYILESGGEYLCEGGMVMRGPA